MDESVEGSNLTKSKVELEIERHLLSTIVKLSDGTTGNVFSRGTKNESKIFSYNCHLCGVANLPGERCLQTHIAGRKHQTKLSLPSIDAETFRAPLVQKNKIQMHIAPGEPVPPGFENEVKPVAELQSSIDKFKDQALIGLEYIMELIMGADKEPCYHCVLCDKRGDPRTIITHLTSYNHRIKFLEKHFPSVTREINPYRFNKDARIVIQRIVQTVCEAVEDHHGRLTPNVHDNNDYIKNRMRHLQDVINDKHFDEKNGPSFTNVIDRKLILDTIKRSASADKKREPSPPIVLAPNKKIKTESIKGRADRKSLDSISSISSSSLSESESDHRPARDRRVNSRERYPERRLRPLSSSRSRSRSRSPVKTYRRSNSPPPPYRHSQIPQRPTTFNRREAAFEGAYRRNFEKTENEPEKKRQILPTPKELSMQASEIANERYKWEKFRCMVEIAVVELDKTQNEYEKNPEKHPMYPEEWKKFWNKRYKELQAEKKDPAKHDFKPEWIEFWTRRMKELYNEEVDKKKNEIRLKLQLPDESEEKTDQLKEQYSMKIIKKRTPPPRSDDDDDDDDCNIVEECSTRPPLKRRSRSRRSESPWSGDRDHRPRSSTRNNVRSEKFREWERERERGDYYRSPPSHYSETYEEWSKRYYGPKRGRPTYIRNIEYNKEDDDDADEVLTVVSVLRLLTALEDHLGSLGPKVIDILAKALALEKVKANSADEMLLNDDNCVLFETVKEKLKGQLIAKVIEPPKIHAVKKAIKNIAALIHQVNENAKKEKEEKVKNEKIQDINNVATAATKSIITSSGAVFDKTAIAQKIATALIAQGKTDITTEQLEQLIQTFIVMSKMSQEAKKPISTANYLSELEQATLIKDKEREIAVAVAVAAAKEKKEKEIEKEKLDEQLRPNISAELEKSIDNKDVKDSQDASSALESLTDSDLQTLLQNFKDLSSEEQQHLIAYLKKLEATDPNRVEKLRKYVNLDTSSTPLKKVSLVSKAVDLQTDISGRMSPFSLRESMENTQIPMSSSSSSLQQQQGQQKVKDFGSDDEEIKKFIDSDDDDDYTFDDVVKAASKNIKDKQLLEHMKIVQDSLQLEQRLDDELSNASKTSSYADSTKSTSTLKMSLAETSNLIANLMGSLQKNVASRTTATTPAASSSSSLLNVPSISPTTIIPSLASVTGNSPSNKNISTDNLKNLPYYQQQQQQLPISQNFAPQQNYPSQQQQHNYGNNTNPYGQQIYPQQQQQQNSYYPNQQQQPFNNFGQAFQGQQQNQMLYQQQQQQSHQQIHHQQQQLQQQHTQNNNNLANRYLGNNQSSNSSFNNYY